MHHDEAICPNCGSPDADHRWRVDMEKLQIIDSYLCVACGIRTEIHEAFEHTRVTS